MENISGGRILNDYTLSMNTVRKALEKNFLGETELSETAFKQAK